MELLFLAEIIILAPHLARIVLVPLHIGLVFLRARMGKKPTPRLSSMYSFCGPPTVSTRSLLRQISLHDQGRQRQ